jgi:uncharacterized membrane protein YedE/YeeE
VGSYKVRHGVRLLVALAAGTVFGLGLALAQMIDPLKVLAFLDVAGRWDGSLLFVLGGAVLLAAIGFRWVLGQPQPLFDDRFFLPTVDRVDRRLLLGAAIFGAGWGLGGYCPGPAIASLAYANPEALWFVPAMLAGAGLQRWWANRASTPSLPPDPQAHQR